MDLFQIRNPCKNGKELYNGKCLKMCAQGKIRNPHTGRCIKEKIKVKTVSNRSSTIKKYKTCPFGKEMYNGKCVKPCSQDKIRNLRTGRCIKQKTQKQYIYPLRDIIKKSPPFAHYVPVPKTPSLYAKQNKNIGNEIYQRYNLDQESINYLNKFVVKNSATKMRRIARDNGLYIQLYKYPNDDDMKKYVLIEILELSKNDARDRFRTNDIRLFNINYVIDNDVDLSMILKQ